MKKIPELLAPAGGFEQLTAAVENGADAIYMGGRSFNARINADNFNDDEIKKAMEYAHVRGVRLYMTMNTLLSDQELPAALDQAEKFYLAGADALILQDIGFAAAVKKYLPDMPIHFSTQGTIYNIEGVRAAEKLGFERVILARELDIPEIEAICRLAKAQIEVFIHGALCFCYSGQCEMSYILGGRSGNKGNCAQPCRLPYTLIRIPEDRSGKQKQEMETYQLSPKDLSGISLIGRLAEAGVSSLKIEGRMKSPEYVAITTGLYRKYLDLYAANEDIYKGSIKIDDADQKSLRQIFSRGDFTTGYLEGNPGKNILSGSLPKHQGMPIGKVRAAIPERRLIEISLTDKLSIGDGIEIQNPDLPGNLVTYLRVPGRKNDTGAKNDVGQPGDTAIVGYIDGPVFENDPVFKITDKELNKAARESYSKAGKKVKLDCLFTAVRSKSLLLVLKDADGHLVSETSESMPEEARNLPVTDKMIREQLKKTGGTPFWIDECSIELDEGISVALSEINRIRRSALIKMEELRKNKYQNRVGTAEIQSLSIGNTSAKSADPHTAMKKCLYFYDLGSRIDGAIVNPAFEQELFDVARIYLPYDCFLSDRYLDIFSDYCKRGTQLLPVLPPITKGYHDLVIRENLSRIASHQYAAGICAGNPGWATVCADAGMSVYGDYSLNIHNSFSFFQAKAWGLIGATASHETTAIQLSHMDFHGIEAEYAIYGRIPVMVSEHCMIGNQKKTGCGDQWSNSAGNGCMECQKGQFWLKDRKGEKFPVIADHNSCRSTILSYSKKADAESISMLRNNGVDCFRMYIFDETIEEIKGL